jgi:hypothetical protein
MGCLTGGLHLLFPCFPSPVAAALGIRALRTRWNARRAGISKFNFLSSKRKQRFKQDRRDSSETRIASWLDANSRALTEFGSHRPHRLSHSLVECCFNKIFITKNPLRSKPDHRAPGQLACVYSRKVFARRAHSRLPGRDSRMGCSPHIPALSMMVCSVTKRSFAVAFLLDEAGCVLVRDRNPPFSFPRGRSEWMDRRNTAHNGDTVLSGKNGGTPLVSLSLTVARVSKTNRVARPPSLSARANHFCQPLGLALNSFPGPPGGLPLSALHPITGT